VTFDAQLLASFRRGDRAALERVYWECVDEVERSVRRGIAAVRLQAKGLGAADARDLVHETFARAFEERARLAYDGLRPYLPFLCTIARNLVIDLARKQGREITVEDLDAMAESPEPELPYAEPEVMRAVESYLANLPPELRGVHERRYVIGETQEAAARALGLSRQQIRTLERRLRDGLAAHLRNQDETGLVKIYGSNR
jgi:RNA polymerase sigma-70 factor (ECF subfamily)